MSQDQLEGPDIWLLVLALAAAPTWEDAAAVLEADSAGAATELEEQLVTIAAGAMYSGDRDLADTLTQAALLVHIAMESSPSQAAREITGRMLPKHVPGPETLGRVRVEGLRRLRDEAVG